METYNKKLHGTASRECVGWLNLLYNPLMFLYFAKHLIVLSIPFEPRIWGWAINVHLILEYVAFFSAYRYCMIFENENNGSDPPG